MGIFEGQAFSSFAAAAANARENLRVHGTLGEDPAPRDENGKVCGENPQKALVLSSGGVDSSTLLALAVKRFGAENVFALSISYGQRHEKEIESAKAVAAHYGVEQRFLDLSAIFADSDCSLLEHSSQDVPEESYAEQIDEADGSPGQHVRAVPQRTVPLERCVHGRWTLGASVLFYGAHHDDWAGDAYPDCSIEFVNAMNLAITQGTAASCTWRRPSCPGRRPIS